MARSGNRARQRPSASSPANGLSQRLEAWRDNHRLVALQSIQRLIANPISSSMTLLVLAIAITLPAALNIAIGNFAQLSGQAGESVQMSIYLQADVATERGQLLARQIADWQGVANTEYVSPQQARDSFSGIEGFDEIISSLPTNPLPGTIIVNISEDSLTVNQANELKSKAQSLESVELAKIDLEWLQKLRAIIGLAEQLAAGLTLLLGIGVVLVVGNTIKLAIDNRRDEIIVTKLVGATNAFVRRPFLYMGLWFGFGGAVLALIMLILCKLVITSSLEAISELYGADIGITGLGFAPALYILISGALLGWIGAWLASSRHIRALEPR